MAKPVAKPITTPSEYLHRCIPSLNENKLFGMRAEADFRSHMATIGLLERVSPGGWIFRQKGTSGFGNNTIAVFPHKIDAAADYSKAPSTDAIPLSLHTICATMHQIGIKSYYAHPIFPAAVDLKHIRWVFIQLGVPWPTHFIEREEVFSSFSARSISYNYLRHETDVSSLTPSDVMVHFSHENLRVFVESNICLRRQT